MPDSRFFDLSNLRFLKRPQQLRDRSYHDVDVIHLTEEVYIHSKRKSLDTLPVAVIPSFASFA